MPSTPTLAHTLICPIACPPARLPAAQLVCTFTVVGVALVGKLWLGLPIPHALYPAAALMVAGSCMVMLPNIVVSSHLPALARPCSLPDAVGGCLTAVTALD
jgi:hypothetical protein